MCSCSTLFVNICLCLPSFVRLWHHAHIVSDSSDRTEFEVWWSYSTFSSSGAALMGLEGTLCWSGPPQSAVAMAPDYEQAVPVLSSPEGQSTRSPTLQDQGI